MSRRLSFAVPIRYVLVNRPGCRRHPPSFIKRQSNRQSMDISRVSNVDLKEESDEELGTGAVQESLRGGIASSDASETSTSENRIKYNDIWWHHEEGEWFKIAKGSKARWFKIERGDAQFAWYMSPSSEKLLGALPLSEITDVSASGKVLTVVTSKTILRLSADSEDVVTEWVPMLQRVMGLSGSSLTFLSDSEDEGGPADDEGGTMDGSDVGNVRRHRRRRKQRHKCAETAKSPPIDNPCYTRSFTSSDGSSSEGERADNSLRSPSSESNTYRSAEFAPAEYQFDDGRDAWVTSEPEYDVMHSDVGDTPGERTSTADSRVISFFTLHVCTVGYAVALSSPLGGGDGVDGTVAIHTHRFVPIAQPFPFFFNRRVDATGLLGLCSSLSASDLNSG